MTEVAARDWLCARVMAFCELHFRSEALGKQTSCNVILPESGTGPFPVFYLLHGLSDDHTMWMRRSSIERHVQELPLIVVMPDGGRSFYCDTPAGDNYETAIVRDLVGFIDSRFQTRAERGGRVIGGLSMGGYGALKLAMQHPDLFCAANSHSGSVQWAYHEIRADADEWWRQRVLQTVGPNARGGRDDLYALAAQFAAAPASLPALRIDCGTEDFLIEPNRDFHALLETLGVPHEYAEFAGAHDWAFWDLHVQDALAFHRRHLEI